MSEQLSGNGWNRGENPTAAAKRYQVSEDLAEAARLITRSDLIPSYKGQDNAC